MSAAEFSQSLLDASWVAVDHAVQTIHCAGGGCWRQTQAWRVVVCVPAGEGDRGKKVTKRRARAVPRGAGVQQQFSPLPPFPQVVFKSPTLNLCVWLKVALLSSSTQSEHTQANAFLQVLVSVSTSDQDFPLERKRAEQWMAREGINLTPVTAGTLVRRGTQE